MESWMFLLALVAGVLAVIGARNILAGFFTFLGILGILWMASPDTCPNLAGRQWWTPSGYGYDYATGNCLVSVNPPPSGIPPTVPTATPPPSGPIAPPVAGSTTVVVEPNGRIWQPAIRDGNSAYVERFTAPKAGSMQRTFNGVNAALYLLEGSNEILIAASGNGIPVTLKAGAEYLVRGGSGNGGFSLEVASSGPIVIQQSNPAPATTTNQSVQTTTQPAVSNTTQGNVQPLASATCEGLNAGYDESKKRLYMNNILPQFTQINATRRVTCILITREAGTLEYKGDKLQIPAGTKTLFWDQNAGTNLGAAWSGN